MDYVSWTKRTSAFLRSLTHLPGELEISDGIEPPGTDDYTQSWLYSSDCSLPKELKAFISTASKRCFIRYVWKAPLEFRSRLGDIFGDCHELIGGGDFCEAARFSLFDNRSWFQNELPPMMENAGKQLQAIFPMLKEAMRDPAFASTYDDILSSTIGKAVNDDERIRNSITLMSLDSGAKIVLECKQAQGSMPVVFVDGVDPTNRKQLSRSFDQFLLDWEKLCYIAPTLENLRPWLDPVNGCLNSENEKAILLREILRTASQAGKE